MSAKMGRPKVDNPKTNVVRARLNDEKAKLLDEYCRERGITQADAVREGIDLLLHSQKK